MILRVFSAAAAALCLFHGTALAQQCNNTNFSFYEHLGDGSVETILEYWNGTSWELTYKATVDGNGLYTVYFRKTNSCGDEIKSLSIITSQVNGSSGQVVVNVGPNSFGQLGYIGTIEKLSGSPILTIGINEIGTIGPGGVSADSIGTINATYSASHTDYTGNILGPITSTSGHITAVYADRDIRGDITSDTYIGIVSTTGGDIGQSGNLVDISVSGDGDDIDWVQGQSIYANITTSNSANPRGEVKRVHTTAGDFTGTLTTFVMQGTPAGQNAINIVGHLYADIDTAVIKTPINITGDLKSGASIVMDLGSKIAGPIDIAGALSGLINLSAPSLDQNEGAITVGSITSGGSISALKDIDGAITVTGAMAGTIETGSSLDGDVSVGSGMTGDIDVGGDLAGTVAVTGAMSGTITTGTSLDGAITVTNGMSGTISSGTSLDGAITVTGDITGTIEAGAVLGGNISTSADMSGTIKSGTHLNGNVSVTDAMSGIIDIGMSLVGDLSVGVSGLEGQVIINSLNGFAFWLGDVKINGTAIVTKGSYTETGLGGGAVGLVPFSCHFEECVPAATVSTTPSLSGDFEVTVRHYGPVKWTTGDPFVVMYCDSDFCAEDEDRTSHFQYTHTAGSRDIVITPVGDATLLGTYHISPSANLKCDGTAAATDPSVDSYTYNLEYEG